MTKQVLAIHDVACFGKCSLTIVLPVLSASGLSTSVLPTTLLSTHTGGYGKPWVRDLQMDMKSILTHWKEQAITFDAIYSGYVSSLGQLFQIQACFLQYPNSFHIVDPVMGDHGKLYASLPKELPMQMRELCKMADLITPNMSEAYALLQEPYCVGPYTKEEIERVCFALAKFCKGDILLTSISFHENDCGTAIFHHKEQKVTYEMRERMDAQSHGTGDLFTSSVCSAYVNGCGLSQAVRLATDYVLLTLEKTFQKEHDERTGLDFETNLCRFVESMCMYKTDDQERN